jgi:hypothetical protein
MASAQELHRYRSNLADELDSAAFSTFRQIAIGLAAAAFTAGAGHLLGVSVS